MNRTRDPRQDEFGEEVRQLISEAGPHFQTATDWGLVIVLVAHVQLALRHPGNTGSSSVSARRWKDNVIGIIGQFRPRLAELLKLGDDPSEDVETVAKRASEGDSR